MKPAIFVLDNYDSFTYNLVQYLGELGARLEIARNDRITVDQVAAWRPHAVVISPGPGKPAEAGISLSLVQWCADQRVSLLGVCLGHQAIGQAFGGRIVRAATLMHGKSTEVHHDGAGVLRGLPSPFEAGRYHSLVVDPESLPPVLEVTARTPDGVVMGLRHRSLPVEGVQFHPESVLTPDGMRVLRNFVSGAQSVDEPD
ncbi:MAG TPA: aminodeoxychorismate/anthranilate synthase component II [Actinomycetota bacterium]|nr:aminodeoxychorismate/anthranilate synthase component II [Actinomycetota bacterium]